MQDMYTKMMSELQEENNRLKEENERLRKIVESVDPKSQSDLVLRTRKQLQYAKTVIKELQYALEKEKKKKSFYLKSCIFSEKYDWELLELPYQFTIFIVDW